MHWFQTSLRLKRSETSSIGPTVSLSALKWHHFDYISIIPLSLEPNNLPRLTSEFVASFTAKRTLRLKNELKFAR